jgi:diguanylate cyclase (GGDEF)-like protein
VTIETVGARESRTPFTAAAAAIVAAALAALLAAGWVAVVSVSGSERDRADARLAGEARAAAAAFTANVAAADARAGSVASSSTLQRALARGNVARLRTLVTNRPNLALYLHGRRVAGSLPASAVAREVAVVARGRTLGRVVAFVPLDASFFARLAARAHVQAPDRLRVVRGSSASSVPLGRAFDSARNDERVFPLRVVDPPRAVVLEAATPRSAITHRAHRRLWLLVLASVASIVTLAVLVFGIRRVVPPERMPPRRGRDVRQVLALVGDALGSTHEPARLLPIALHATMEATGALGGVAMRDENEVAREGTFAGVGPPLRLDLDGSGEETDALILYPPARGFDSRTVALARTLAAQAAVALENARLHGLVKQQSVTDELTGLANRRSFRETLETELLRAERFGTPLSLVLADLDDFKLVNDRFGHQAGDRVLQAFADVLQGRIRGIDLAARIGGEEFAVLLPGTDAAGANALGESLRDATAELAVATDSGLVRVTASFGVASFPQTHTADELMTSADLALYGAKRQGKNRVVSVEPQAT